MFQFNYNLKNSITKKRMLILGIIIVMGTMVRIYFAYHHFTHYDDIGYLNSCYGTSRYGSYVQELLEGIGFLNNIFVNLESNLIFKWMDVCVTWTYAPLQEIMNIAILSILPESTSLAMYLFIGRLPSMLFGVGAILGAYFCVEKITNKFGMVYSHKFGIMASLIIAFTYENIIYSAQAEPYSIGVFALFLYIKWLLDVEFKSKKTFYMLSVFNILLFLIQYHFVIIIASSYMVIFIEMILKRNYKEIKKIIGSGLCTVIMLLPVICIFLTKGLLDRGTNWNIGIDEQFLFAISDTSSLLTNIRDICCFFISNTIIVIRSFFVYHTSNIYSNSVAIILIIIMVLGFINLHLKQNRDLFRLTILMDGIVIITTILIVLQKMTYSPSRHIMYLYPIYIIYLCMGIMFIHSCMRCKLSSETVDRIVLLIILMISFLIIGVFTFTLKDEIECRNNLITEEYVQELLEEYEPDVLFLGNRTFDGYLMGDFEGYYKLDGEFNNPLWTCCYVKENIVIGEEEEEYMMMFVHRHTSVTLEDEESFVQVLLGEQDEYYLEVENCIYNYELPEMVEVEYARDVFYNCGNGLTINIYEVTY